MTTNTLQVAVRLVFPTGRPAEQLAEAAAEHDAEGIRAAIAAAHPGALVHLDGVEIAGGAASGDGSSLLVPGYVS